MRSEEPKHELLAKSNPILAEGFGVENLSQQNCFYSNSSSQLTDNQPFITTASTFFKLFQNKIR